VAGVIGDRWGVTQPETLRHYPCDEVMPDPTMQAWRGVPVRARPEQVWPWVRQIRLAPYSYDLLDNLGRRSPQRLIPLSDPRVGDPFTTAIGRPTGRILAVTPREHLTAEIMGAVMSYVLVLEGPTTRLLLKVVARPHRAVAPLFCLGDLVMARRQLLNLAHLAQCTCTS
jgi:hypothetical protein